MTDDKQLESRERELAERLGTPLEQLRAQRAHCPPLDAVRALASGAMPQEMEASLRQHVANCPTCTAIASDLQDDELTAPTAGELQRIGARVAVGRGDAAQSASAKATNANRPTLGLMIWRPLLAMGVLAILALTVFQFAPQQAPPTPPVAQQPPPQTIPEALRLVMPAVRLSASAVLVTRGEGGSQQYLKDLAPAFEAYRAEKYAEAARLFAALEAKYPKASEVFFYGGVSRLHQQEHREGLRLLEQARRLDEPDFADEVSFYLALAQQRTGNSAGARAEFEKLCAAKQESSARACDAAQALNANTAR